VAAREVRLVGVSAPERLQDVPVLGPEGPRVHGEAGAVSIVDERRRLAGRGHHELLGGADRVGVSGHPVQLRVVSAADELNERHVDLSPQLLEAGGLEGLQEHGGVAAGDGVVAQRRHQRLL
jgi:hypothetical protein